MPSGLYHECFSLQVYLCSLSPLLFTLSPNRSPLILWCSSWEIEPELGWGSEARWAPNLVRPSLSELCKCWPLNCVSQVPCLPHACTCPAGKHGSQDKTELKKKKMFLLIFSLDPSQNFLGKVHLGLIQISGFISHGENHVTHLDEIGEEARWKVLGKKC